MTALEIVRFTKAGGPLTKRISLASDGALLSDGSACVMTTGTAHRVRVTGIRGIASLIEGLGSSHAIALGALRHDLPDEVQVTTKHRLNTLNGSAAPDLIARTGEHIAYSPDQPALALIDIDTKGMPATVKQRIDAAGGFWAALVSVLSELTATGHVLRRSTSTGISRTDTGELLPGSNGLHVFVLVKDGADVERFLRTLHARCWLRGLGWMMVGAGGQLLERSLIDRMVYAPERLVFEGAPILEAPLVQDQASRAPTVSDGPPLDSRAVCLDLSLVEQAKLRDLQAAERHRLAADAENSRAAFIDQQAERIVRRTGCSQTAARHAVERQCGGVLLPSVVLPFDATDLAGSTVGDVLADTAKFVGATLADPLEGEEYGRCKAKIMRRPDGSAWINSFAHGRTTYELKYDATAVEAALRAGEPASAADRFVALLFNAELAADEELRLRDLACELSGAKIRPLTAKIKAARQEQERQRADAKRQDRSAQRQDSRIRLPAPAPDGERLPVLRALDEVLTSVTTPEPPMRDIEGHPVEVRCRPPLALHELSAGGSNQAEPEKTRLPPPELPLLTAHTRHTLAHEIERHIEFVLESESGDIRPVALPPVFVEHYLAYRDSTLPRVGAVVTAPLVLPDGSMLAPQGLDRERKLVFRIEPALLELMPAPRDCLSAGTATALDYLANEWLCDVATDFAGKCVLIAMALTILERVLLPERPAFFVTAGKRGGGKTTALTMLILAVTGKKPPAAAWSPNEEERRKAMLAYLSEGLAALVWDNIPLGAMIACPTLEKVLTSDSYSDRLLGQSVSVTVPAHTVMAFTGNNIAPKGDMASRSLLARLDVDRPDPENRAFKHADPIAWTLDNRGEILRCLYTILLGNLQLKREGRKDEKTRFKRWWSLVGAAVEHAAAALVKEQESLPPEWRTAKAVDFGALFASVEDEDEDTAGVAEVLDVLHAVWPDGNGEAARFCAADVAERLNTPMEGEHDRATTLRAFFEPVTRRGSGLITPKTVGHRLAAIAGAPVTVGDQIMKLERCQSNDAIKQRRTAWFRVRVV